MEAQYNFDYFIIGGGSGGLASAKEAASLGAKVAVADYVEPTPIGTTWGLGGTCVNVGCIPKKLMHFSSILGEIKTIQKSIGWEIDKEAKHDWGAMVKKIQMHITSLNWESKGQLMDKKVKYYNRLASMIDTHTIELYDPKKNQRETVTARFILIAVGGRPSYPQNIPNAKECCITSDDLFSLKKNPGKTLIIGGSYVALECGGFLHGLNNNVTIMIRSIILRGFDTEMCNIINETMQDKGIRMLYQCTLQSIEMLSNHQKRVTWKNLKDNKDYTDEFDTIILAIGRTPNTLKLNLDKVNVLLDDVTKKIIVNDAEQTNISHIYAIGDCAKDRVELTPTAIMAGRLLARRLFQGSKTNMDYTFVPTTIFTPVEYGVCGYSQEAAIQMHGEANIRIYESNFKKMEWNFLKEHKKDNCHIKIITNNNLVIGLHYVGPNAGEIIQGYAVAIKMGITKEELDDSIQIYEKDTANFEYLSFLRELYPSNEYMHHL